MKAFEARQRKMKRKFGFNNLSILSDKFCLINSNHQVCFRYVHRSTEPGENAVLGKRIYVSLYHLHQKKNESNYIPRTNEIADLLHIYFDWLL